MRSEIIAAVIDAITALDAIDTDEVTVEEFTGDDEIFNEGAVFPFIGVCYAAGKFDPVEEIGGDSPFMAFYGVEVVVQTRDTSAQERDGQAQALALLDAIEKGLHGQFLTLEGGDDQGPVKINLLDEMLDTAWSGRFSYSQQYRAEALITR